MLNTENSKYKQDINTSYIKHRHQQQHQKIITILAIAFLLFCVNSNTCPQSCATCTSDSNCTQCNSQSYVVLVSPNSGCLPCPTKCQACTNQSASNKCQTCSNGYFINLQTSYCIKCQTPNCNICNVYSPDQCTTCQDGFYLEGATSTCKNCSVYLNAVTCRQNVILTCLSGYFSNNGLYCTSCSSNCTTCSSTSFCTKCSNGFYMSSSVCKACQSSCLTCIGSSACSSCRSGYKLNSSSLCSVCSTINCILCSLQDVCSVCANNYYLNSANKTCVLINSSQIIANCIQYQNNTTVTNISNTSIVLSCISCNSNFYLSSYYNSCQFCSILCQNCNNYFRTSHCASCSSYSQLVDSTNGFCKPKLFSDENQNILYLNNRNNIDNYQFYGSSNTIQDGLNNCPGGKLSSQLYINFGSEIGFQFKVYLKFLFSTSKTSFSLNVSINDALVQSLLFATMNSSSSTLGSAQNAMISCGSAKIARSSLNFTNSNNILLKNNNLIKFVPENNSDLSILVGLSQIMFVYKQCQQSCGICLSYYSCISCVNSSYFLEKQKCVATCSNGFFFNNATLISDILLINNMSVYSSTNFCSTNCLLGTFESIKTSAWTCQKCHLSCKSCTSQTHCLTCNSGFYLYNNSCLPACPSKSYPNSIFNRCQSCTIPCLQCSSLSRCSSCQLGFLYQSNHKCLGYCPDTYYPDYSKLYCLKCEYPCLTCISLDKCLSCNISSNLTLYDNNCVVQCPAGFFIIQTQITTQQCKACSFPCLQCVKLQNMCTKCITGYLLNSLSQCVTNCPSGYASSNTLMECLTCQSPCKYCQNGPNLCISCISGYNLQINSFQCISNSLACSSGYYIEQITHECLACVQNCKTCSSYFNCTSCNQEYYLQGENCLTQCYQGYYSDFQANSCQICDKNCRSCFGSPDFCLSCFTYGFLQVNNTCSSNCLVTQLFPGCQACQFPCYSCQNETYYCTSCQNQYYLTVQMGQCSNECYYGYYKTAQNGFGKCEKCSSPCQSCKSINNCLICFKQMNGTAYYLQPEGISRVCKSQCNLFYYANQKQSLCLPCQSPCLQCISQNQCLSCQNGILSGFNCLRITDGCPIGQYLLQSLNNTLTCKTCPNECLSCSTQTNCTGCKSSYFLINHQCNSTCPSGYVENSELNQCLLCEFPCKECQGQPTYCTQCSQLQLSPTASASPPILSIECPDQSIYNSTCIRYYLYDGECLSQCLSITYPSKSQCVNCPSPCLTCQSQFVCTSCLTGYYILQSSCYKVCQNGYYINKVLKICDFCSYPCSKCESFQICLECSEGYLFNSSCLVGVGCPTGRFQDFDGNLSKICSLCNSSCVACSSNSNNCLQCQNTFSNFQGVCYTTCPSGYYTINISSQFVDQLIIKDCQKCPSQCLTCVSQSKCLICQYSYYLFNNVCLSKCPSSFMYYSEVIQIQATTSNQINFYFGLLTIGMNTSNNTCVKCILPCKECTYSQTVCSSCIDNYYYYDSSCYYSCPQSTYYQKLSQKCVQCQFPCIQCYENQTSSHVICTQCLAGHYVQNNFCITACNQNLYIDSNEVFCVSQCKSLQYFSTDFSNIKYCLKECLFPFIKYYDENNNSLICSTSCMNDYFYIDSSGWCRSRSSVLEISGSISVPKVDYAIISSNKQVLTIIFQFESDILYKLQQSLSNLLNISFTNVYFKTTQSLQNTPSASSLLSNSSRLLLSPNFQSENIYFRIISQTSNKIVLELSPQQDLLPQTQVKVQFVNNTNLFLTDSISGVPIQQSSYIFVLNEMFQKYSIDMLENKFSYIGEVVVDFALILALFLLFFNLYSKIYNFLILSQSLFMLALLQIAFPPNLYQFLQGFKASHFYQLGNWIAPQTNIFSYKSCSTRQHVISIYNDCSFFKVAGHTFNIYLVLLFVVFIMVVSKFILKCQNTFIKEILAGFSYRLQIIKWSHINDLFFSLGMITICGFFIQTCTSFQTSNPMQSLSIFISFALCLPCLAYFMYFIYKNKKLLILATQNSNKFEQKKYLFRQDYICYMDGINNPRFLFKNYILVGKICLYGFLIGLFGNWPLLCLSVFIVLQLLTSVIYCLFTPYSDQKQNQIYSICGVLHSIALFLIAIIQFLTYDPTKQTGDRNYNPDEIKQKKWVLGYVVIILILSIEFLLILEIIISIIRGSMKKKRLSAQLDELQFNKDKLSKLINVDMSNSPVNFLQKNIILVQKSAKLQKKQFEGYKVQMNQNQDQDQDKEELEAQQIQQQYKRSRQKDGLKKSVGFK